MSIRLQITHKEKTGSSTVTYRADIVDADYNGSVIERLVTGTFFDWEYEKLDERNPFENPVQKSSFGIHLRIQSSSELDILTDILDADEDRFSIDFYIDGTHKWSGKVLTDLLDYPEGPFPFSATIGAKDLSVLKTKIPDFGLISGRSRLSVIIATCLKETGFSFPIRSFTNITNTDIGSSDDFLFGLWHHNRAFRKNDQEMKALEVLENICRAYNLIIRQSDAKWLIEQLPAVAKGDDTQYDYDADGLNPVSSTPNRTVTIDRIDSFLLRNSRNKITGALKEITSSYNHRTPILNIPTEDVEYTFSSAPTETFSLGFENEGVYALAGSLDASAYLSESNPGGSVIEAYFRVRGLITGSDDVYMNDSGSWGTTQVDIPITLTGAGTTVTGSFSIAQSSGVPSAVTEIQITPLFAEVVDGAGTSVSVTQTNYTNIDFYIFQTVRSIIDSGATIGHSYTRSGNYSVTEEIPQTILGDGPTPESVGAPNDTQFGSGSIPVGNFKVKGEAGSISLEELTLREHVSMRRSWLKNIRASLWMKYSPESLISYRGDTWFFLGGQFRAKRSKWDANILLLAYDGDTTGDSFQTVVESGGDPSGAASGTPGSGSGISLSDADARYFQQDNHLSEATDLPTLRANIGLGTTDNVQFALTTVANATAGGHAVNRTTGDGRWGQLTAPNTWTGLNIFDTSSGIEVGATTSSTVIRGRQNNYDLDGLVIQTKNEAGTYVNRIEFTTGMAFGDSQLSRMRFMNCDQYAFTGGVVTAATAILQSTGGDILLAARNDTNETGIRVSAASGITYLQAGYDSSSLNAHLRFSRSFTATSKISQVDFYTNNFDIFGNLNVSDGDGTFSGVVTAANATADTHLVNRITGDGRWGQLTAANTWTEDQTINPNVDSFRRFHVIRGTGVSKESAELSARNIISRDENDAIKTRLDFNNNFRFYHDVRVDTNILISTNTVINSSRDYFGRDGNFSRNLFVEGGLFAKEFVVDTTRVFLSSRFGSGGVVAEITDATVGSEKIKFHDQFGNDIVPFADNDLLLIQERTGVNSGTIVKSIKRKVVADSQTGNVVSLTTTGATTGTDVGAIAVGDQAVLDGNTTNTARDSFIEVDVLDRDVAAFGFIDGRTDFGGGSEVMRLGGMEPGGAAEYDASITGKFGIAAKDASGNPTFVLTETQREIGGWGFNDVRFASTNLSGGSDGNFTTAGILLHSAGWLSAPNFALGTTGSKMGDLTIDGILDFSMNGFLQNSTADARIAMRSEGFVFDVLQSGSWSRFLSVGSNGMAFRDTLQSFPASNEATVNIRLPNTDPVEAYKWYVKDFSNLAAGDLVVVMSEGSVTPPGSPTNVSICKSSNAVIISWDAVTGANTYDVQREELNVGNWTDVATGITGTSTGDTTPFGNQSTDYRWRVRACNAGGCSSYTNSPSGSWNTISAC